MINDRCTRKCGAVCVVLMMMAVAAVPLIESADLGWFGGIGEAEADTKYYWTYTLKSDTDGKIAVAGSGYDRAGNPIDASPSAIGPGTTGTYVSTSTTNVGSWAFNGNTGYGPFNSFYAAFDAGSSNRMLCILNPYDLTKSIDGTLVSSYTTNPVNIMWCLPTVYWKADSSTGALTLTNDPKTGGTAYAHTVYKDGKDHTYDYIAIGVYEAATATIQSGDSNKTILTSQSDAKAFGMASDGDTKVLVSQTRATMRGYANTQAVSPDGTTTGTAMLWNFYQYELYKYCALATMGSWDSQGVAGNGYADEDSTVSGSGYGMGTGTMDASGPYAGTISSTDYQKGVKLFIENPWGSLSTFVDGIVFQDRAYVIDQNAVPTDAVAAGTGVTVLEDVLPSSGWGSDPSSKAQIWGMPTGKSGSASSGLYDYVFSGTGSRGFYVSGSLSSLDLMLPYNGLSYTGASASLSNTSQTIGGRLAFVFDMGDYWGYEITPDAEVTGYGTAVANPTPIGGKGTYVSSNGNHVGSWGFYSNGYGPFGSFYAAFDASNNNRMLCILDPNNLQYSITGKPLSDYGDGVKNIMWVLPTIYWMVMNSGSLYLTNDPSLGGVAYAHTVGGHIYKYIAIGVYEAATATVDSNTILTSQSDAGAPASDAGTKVLVEKDRGTMRDWANNQAVSPDGTAGGAAMLWNFYQYELYKYCALATMGSWDSQGVAGNGYVYRDTTVSGSSGFGMGTGTMDASGPYAGTIGSANADYQKGVKLFIENPWGSLNTFVDGIVFNGSKYYIDTKAVPDDSTSGAYVTSGSDLVTSSGWGSSPSANAATWGFATATGGSATSGLYDYVYSYSTASDRILYVGGESADVLSASYFGLSYSSNNPILSYSSQNVGGRLAFVFDGEPVSEGTAQITSIADVQTTVGTETVTVEAVTVRLTIPSSSAASEGTLSLDGVYWIEAGDGIRTYGDLSTLGLDTVSVSEDGTGMLRFTVTFQMKDADHHVYNVYAKYAYADGTTTVLSSTVFAEDPAVPQASS